MKNSIWVGKNDNGKSYTHTRKMHIEDGLLVDKEGCLSINSDKGFNYYPLDIYNLNLKPLEIVEVIIDTETQKYEVKRPRGIGWYLVECKEIEDDGLIFAAHWDGKNWNPVRNKAKWRLGVTWKGLDENEVTVISEKLPYNEYLRSLE